MDRGKTKKNKRMVRSVGALFLAGAMALSACASSGSTTDSGSKSTEAGGGASGKTWTLQTSSTPAMLAALKKAIKDKKPIVVTLWHPHWAYSQMDLKVLKDPKGAMGASEHIYLTANKKWAASHTDLVAALKKFKLDNDQLGNLENLIQNKYPNDMDKAVSTWISKNQDLVDGWTKGLKGNGETVKIGYITWAEDIATTNLWKAILEKHGFKVEATQVQAGPLFKSLASGDLDLFFDTWLPNTHKQYWDKYGDQLTKVVSWYDGSTSLDITVPEYMDINSIADLKKIGDKVNYTITGIEPGAGETATVLCKMMPAYGLASAPTDDTCKGL